MEVKIHAEKALGGEELNGSQSGDSTVLTNDINPTGTPELGSAEGLVIWVEGWEKPMLPQEYG